MDSAYTGEHWALEVSQLNEYVRKLMAGDPLLRALRVRGEISGFKRHTSGHLYFSIKDDQARLQCVMFRQNAMHLRFAPADGMSVVIDGAVSLFVRDGSYQLYCQEMRKEGAGALHLRFEALKKRLGEEGLFDPALKRPIPIMPRAIGVVTSRTGAVLRDIVRVARRRNPRIDICLCAASVQGEGAAQEIAAALDLLNQRGGVDVILCGRGGGSMEDLWPFNEEIVARAIRRSRIPVISCVGHETDFTIADFAADARAATPSAAAEMAVPMLDEWLQALAATRARMERAQIARLALLQARLARLCEASFLTMPERMFFERRAHRLELLLGRLARAAAARSQLASTRLAVALRALAAVNPLAVLARGYALVTDGERVIARAADLVPGQEARLRMRDGEAGVRVMNRKVEPES